MSWLSTLIFGKDPGQTATARTFEESIADTGAASRAATSQYTRDSASFDPSAAFKEYASGAEGDFNRDLGLALRNLSGKAVGQGRFDSGFYDADQGEVARSIASDFSNKIAQGALQTSGMRLGQIGQEGQFALGSSGMYNDLLSGQLDRETAYDNARRQRRAAGWSALGRFGGQAIGALGPIGKAGAASNGG